jgi:hypothetical protein
MRKGLRCPKRPLLYRWLALFGCVKRVHAGQMGIEAVDGRLIASTVVTVRVLGGDSPTRCRPKAPSQYRLGLNCSDPSSERRECQAGRKCYSAPCYAADRAGRFGTDIRIIAAHPRSKHQITRSSPVFTLRLPESEHVMFWRLGDAEWLSGG